MVKFFLPFVLSCNMSECFCLLLLLLTQRVGSEKGEMELRISWQLVLIEPSHSRLCYARFSSLRLLGVYYCILLQETAGTARGTRLRSLISSQGRSLTPAILLAYQVRYSVLKFQRVRNKVSELAETDKYQHNNTFVSFSTEGGV